MLENTHGLVPFNPVGLDHRVQVLGKTPGILDRMSPCRFFQLGLDLSQDQK
ncbi:hypothetical protein [Thiohalorhabdus methylotrophus]|uniref:Uncharacterized protein n=1 Tax=Thiohalorhabdus methylotrophus TaxID=3242694 RepID=A0ABV4TY92_9GAMM